MKVVGIRLPDEVVEKLKKIPDWSRGYVTVNLISVFND